MFPTETRTQTDSGNTQKAPYSEPQARVSGNFLISTSPVVSSDQHPLKTLNRIELLISSWGVILTGEAVFIAEVTQLKFPSILLVPYSVRVKTWYLKEVNLLAGTHIPGLGQTAFPPYPTPGYSPSLWNFLLFFFQLEPPDSEGTKQRQHHFYD